LRRRISRISGGGGGVCESPLIRLNLLVSRFSFIHKL
jgi:hypothetical protein